MKVTFPEKKQHCTNVKQGQQQRMKSIWYMSHNNTRWRKKHQNVIIEESQSYTATGKLTCCHYMFNVSSKSGTSLSKSRGSGMEVTCHAFRMGTICARTSWQCLQNAIERAGQAGSNIPSATHDQKHAVNEVNSRTESTKEYHILTCGGKCARTRIQCHP